MKKVLWFALAIAIGCVMGYYCRKPKTVTVEKEIVKYYPKKEIRTLEFYKYIPEYVFLPADSVKVVYRGQEPVYQLPKKRYYSTVGDVEIYHSGVASSIDSVRVFSSKVVPVQNSYKNSISVSAELLTSFSCPVKISYGHYISPRTKAYVLVGYDILQNTALAGIGCDWTFKW